jgi:hypothetical protein
VEVIGFFGVILVIALLALAILAVLMPWFVYRNQEFTYQAWQELRGISKQLGILISLTRPEVSPDTPPPERQPISILPDTGEGKIGHIRCNTCGHKMEYAKRLGGKEVKCHNCGLVFSLPF